MNRAQGNRAGKQEQKMEKPDIRGRWKKPGKDQILIGILVGVLLLVIALPPNSGTKQEQAGTAAVRNEETEETGPEEKMEQKLKKVLEQVEGVGKVQVMITLKSSGRKTVEKDESISEEKSGGGTDEAGNEGKRTEKTTVFSRDNEGTETPFVIEETAPQVEGVLVAAQGGDNLTVAEDILDAAQVLFGVEAHKIKIMKLN